jgi:hypothetical protein
VDLKWPNPPNLISRTGDKQMSKRNALRFTIEANSTEDLCRMIREINSELASDGRKLSNPIILNDTSIEVSVGQLG